jgi:SAM-dependent methyltransferase
LSSYDLFARFYDLEHIAFSEDIALYLNYAVRCDGPVLEVGCGTGRVSLALAQSGFDVAGIDHSVSMLALARTRLVEAGLSERVQFEKVDVCAFDSSEQFALAIYPLNGFLHLLTIEAQLSALSNIHSALLPGGFLIIDLPNPHTVFVPATDGQLVLRHRFDSPEGSSITSFASTQTDLADQVQYLTLLYDEMGDDRTVHRTIIEMELRFVYRYEMACLLRQTGYELDAVYGSYDLDPYDADSEIMLFVAHKLADGLFERQSSSD